MSYNIGVNVVETSGSATPPLVGASTSVAGFAIVAERGPIDEPVRVTSWAQFQNMFGNFPKYRGAVGVYAVKGFFDNGGSEAWILRMSHGEEPAKAVLSGPSSGQNENKFAKIISTSHEAEDMTRKAVEKYQQNDTATGKEYLDVVVVSIGRIKTLAADSDISGSTSEVINISNENIWTLPEAPDTPLAKNILAKVQQLQTAIYKAQKIHEAAKITAAKQQLEAAIPADGFSSVNDANIIKGKVDAVNAAAQQSTASLTRLQQLRSEIRAPNEQTRKSLPEEILEQVNKARTIQERAFAAIASAVRRLQELYTRETDPTAKAKIKAIIDAVQMILGAWGTIEAGYRGKSNPGVWGRDLKVVIREIGSRGDDKLYSFEVFYPKNAAAAIERFDNLTAQEVVHKVNQTSQFVRINFPENLTVLPTSGFTFAQDSGSSQESTETILANSLSAFEKFNNCSIQMLACPDADNSNQAYNFTNAGIAYCKNEQYRNDCIYVASLPESLKNASADDVKSSDYFKLRQWDRAGSYGSLYAPWIQVFDSLAPNKPREIPPTGHILGVYARIAGERGIWKAPAGDETGLRGVIGLTRQYNDVDHTNMVKEASVNCVRFVPGSGIVVDSSRTLCSDPRWMYVNVRRLFNYVKSTLKDGLKWVRQEPNRESLWNQVKFNVVTPFLMTLWRQGAFGSGTPEQVFTVKCDTDNNPPYLVDQGIFTLEVYFYPSKPAETVVIKVGQQDFGATASE